MAETRATWLYEKTDRGATCERSGSFGSFYIFVCGNLFLVKLKNGILEMARVGSSGFRSIEVHNGHVPEVLLQTSTWRAVRSHPSSEQSDTCQEMSNSVAPNFGFNSPSATQVVSSEGTGAAQPCNDLLKTNDGSRKAGHISSLQKGR